MSNIVKLPPFEVKHVVPALTQTKGWNISDLRVPDTWTCTKGEGITVMVIDTGFSDHHDLEGCIDAKASKSFLPNEAEIHDYNGHSTHCCGIIAARDNHVGMVGVAPECKLITVKVLGRDGFGDTRAVNNALRYAIQIKPHIVSMSLGSPIHDKDQHDLIKQLAKLNIPVIAAAGNSGRSNDVHYPAKYPETIAVTAFDKSGRPARFNSTGPSVDLSAPGVDIYSTYLNQSYASLSGTSMAAPFIAGLAALLLAKHRDQEAATGSNDCKTVLDIKEHLVKYSDDKGVVGKDDVWGYGVVDPVKMIRSLEDSTYIEPPIPSINQSVWSKIKEFFRKVIK